MSVPAPIVGDVDTAPRTRDEIRTAARSIRPRAFALELTKSCNLRCGYCYYASRENAYDPATSMSRETVERSIEMLLREAAPGETVHLHFFGGEPLLDVPLLRHGLAFATRRAAEEGRAITFEVTTNGTRFSEEVCALLDAHRVQVGVSFDGPPEIQDDARPALGGSSYRMALPGLRRFLEGRRGTELEGSTHCSVVVTRRSLDLAAIVAHLEELGFVKIILSPATGGGQKDALEVGDLPELLRAYDALALDHEARLRRGGAGVVLWFEDLMRQLLSGRRKAAFCEGGRDYLGVGADGRLYLCYRFYENDEFAMGSVETGVERDVTERLMALPLEQRAACASCWARHFCGGGCHHENLVTTSSLGDPNPVTCEILRHGMDRTLEMWARLSRDGLLGRRAEVASATDAPLVSAAGPADGFVGEDRPRRRESCHVRDLEPRGGRRERVVYVPETHEVVVLNPTAAFVFDLCDGTRSVAEIVSVLERRYAAPAERLRADLLETLREFRSKGVLD